MLVIDHHGNGVAVTPCPCTMPATTQAIAGAQDVRCYASAAMLASKSHVKLGRGPDALALLKGAVSKLKVGRMCACMGVCARVAKPTHAPRESSHVVCPAIARPHTGPLSLAPVRACVRLHVWSRLHAGVSCRVASSVLCEWLWPWRLQHQNVGGLQMRAQHGACGRTHPTPACCMLHAGARGCRGCAGQRHGV